MLRLVLLLILASAPVTRAGTLTEIGVYYHLERPRGELTHLYVFYVYSLSLPPALEQKLIRQSALPVSASGDPKLGFTKIAGREFPRKVYLASAEEIRSRAIRGAMHMGTNVAALIEEDYGGHNAAVREKLEKLAPNALVQFAVADLVRIQLSDGAIVLLPNKGVWNNGRHGVPAGSAYPSAVGGVVEGDVAAISTLSWSQHGFARAADLHFNRKISHGRTDINVRLKAGFLGKIMAWCEKKIGRDLSPRRELYEELVHENGIFTQEEWDSLGIVDPDCGGASVGGT